MDSPYEYSVHNEYNEYGGIRYTIYNIFVIFGWFGVTWRVLFLNSIIVHLYRCTWITLNQSINNKD